MTPVFCTSVVGAVDEAGALLDGMLAASGVAVAPVPVPPAPGVPCVLVVPAGVLSAGVVVAEPLPVAVDDVSPDGGADIAPPGLAELPAADVLPVVDVLDGLDIDESVFGWSVLLQAPSAATVAAIATH